MNETQNTENKSNLNSPSGAKGSYSQTIQYLYDRLPVFHHIGSAAYKPGLDNTIGLMNALDNPQRQYRTIHIAGTNGKGSVSHLLAAVLQQSGYKTGLYTSPHLVDFRERIRVNGEMITQQYVVDFVEQHKTLFDTIEPSFFEATMAMAFDYFNDCRVDVAIIEVGLGGRLDSTNIILPELSVITNISFDHMGFLGDTLEKIAYEKAGIIKRNIPVVIGETLPETRPVFEAKAQQENAPVCYAEEFIRVKFKQYEQGYMLVETSDKMTYPIGLCGTYQLKNAATALTALDRLKQLGFNIPKNAVTEGFKRVTEITGLQGRWQILQQNPTVVADTGHNAGGFQYIAEQLKSQLYKTLRIVIGMVNDKDISAVLTLLPVDAVYYFTQAAIIRALPAEELMHQGERYGLHGLPYSSVEQAVEAALKEAEPDDFVFIGGSNFVVGEALASLTNRESPEQHIK
ncbi:MAG: folylpolyglutamate synthase/dihydrofolate synthase family protein [Bacteroidota bacterium]|nr:folylpolyglutamate synthase/dihydrofolate synthase family protein [Bacteroidota bacterium]